MAFEQAATPEQRDAVVEHLDSPEYKAKHAGKEVHAGTRLSHLLQGLETEIILNAISDIKSRGIGVESYQFDGFQVPRRYKAEIERWIVEQTKGRVRYALKDFGPPLSKPRWSPFGAMAFAWECKYTKPDRDGMSGDAYQAAVEAAKRECIDKAAAIRVKLKALFEQYAFKSMAPSGIVFLPDANDTVMREPRPISDCRQIFKNLRVPLPIERGGGVLEVKSDNFFDWWLVQPDMRQFNACVFRPPPLECRDGWYNTFRGFKIEETPSQPQDDSAPAIFIEHCINIMEGNAEWGEFLLDLLAHRVQRPGQRTEIGLVILGPQGCGKTSFFSKFAKAMFYADNVLVTEKAEQITGRFNQLARKLVVIWEEADARETAAGADRLKHLITAEQEMIEKKGKDGILCDVCFLPIVIANSLGSKSVHIEKSDRRYVVVRMGAGHAKDPHYFHKLLSHMDDRQYMRGVFDWLCNRDISKYTCGRDWSNARPITETYKDIQQASSDPIELWFDAVAEALKSASGDVVAWPGFAELRPECETMKRVFKDGAQCSAAELYECYAAWLKSSGYEWCENKGKFQTKLSSLANGCKGDPRAWIKKQKTRGLHRYTFDSEMLMANRFGASPGDIRAYAGATHS